MLAPGDRIGGYTVVAPLGGGGMARVYEARDDADREVAIKVPERHVLAIPGVGERFRREGQALALLRNPNVCVVHALGEHEGVPFLAMELLRGGSLASRLERQGRLAWPEAVRHGIGIARALVAIHAAGLVHRDVKPANVLLDESGNVKLGDFGLVGGTENETSPNPLTATGEMIGTPAYMAPEQVNGFRAGPEADIYGLGATLFCLVAGRPPFEGTGVMLFQKVLTDPPEPLERVTPGTPLALARLVTRLLSKSPSDRPRAAVVASELDTIVKSVAPARHGGWLVAAAFAAAALAFGLLVSGRAPAPPPPPPVTIAVVETRAPGVTRLEPGPTLVPVQFRHPSEPRCAAISRDGKLAAIGGAGGRLLLWDLERRQPLRLSGITGDLQALSFSASGTRLVAVSTTSEVAVFDLAKRAVSGTNVEGLRSASLLGDDRALLAFVDRLEVRPIDFASVLLRIPLSAKLRALAISADGSRAVANGRGGQSVVLDLATGATIALLHGTDGRDAVALSSDGTTVATAGRDGPMRVWALSQGGETPVATFSHKGVTSLAFSADGRSLFSGTPDEVARWELDQKESDAPRLRRKPCSSGSRVVATASGGDRLLVVEGPDRSFHLFATDQGRLEELPRGNVAAVSGLAVAPRSGLVVAACGDHVLRAWNPKGELVASGPTGLETHPGALAISPSGERCVVASVTVSLLTFPLGGSNELKPDGRTETPDGALSVAFLGEDRVFASFPNGAVSEWGVPAKGTPKPFLDLADDPAAALAFSSSGESLLVGHRSLELRHVVAGGVPRVLVAESGAKAVSALVLVPGSARRALAGWTDGTLELVDLVKPASVALAKASGPAVVAVAASPDGKLGASSSVDGLIRLWDLEGSQEVAHLDLGPSGDHARAVAFALAGDRLYVGTELGAVMTIEIRR